MRARKFMNEEGLGFFDNVGGRRGINGSMDYCVGFGC